MAKEVQLSADALAILDVLKNANGPLTLAQINEVNGTNFKTGTIVSLLKKGLISKGEDAEVEYVATKMVGTYRIG
jgi:chromosome segregation and condensation protein ScpB